MNPILKKWFYTKLDDMLNSIFIFNQYLVIPRPNFAKVNNIITLPKCKYVIEELYACKIQCEKCIVNIPVDFNNYVKNYYNKKQCKIEEDSIEYIFKWINSLLVLLTDDKSIDDIKNEISNVSTRQKLLDIIDKRRNEIQNLKLNINKTKKVINPEYLKRDEMVDGFKSEFLSFGDIPNITPDEMVIIAKYRTNEPFNIKNLSLITKETLDTLNVQYSKNELNLSDDEFKLIANYRLDLPLIDEVLENSYETDSESENEPDDIKDVKLHEPSGKYVITYKNNTYVVEGGIVIGKLIQTHDVNYKISNAKNIKTYDKYDVEKLNKQDLKLLKRKGWNLSEDVDIDKKYFKINNDNTKDLRDVTRGIIRQREEAREKIPKITKLENKLKNLQTKYENEIEELKNIQTNEFDAVKEYNNFIESRINMFNNYKLPVKNYKLNTDTENYFVSSVVHIINKLCIWLDIKIITIHETKTAVKLLLPKNIAMENMNIDNNSNVMQVLLSTLNKYEYKLLPNVMNPLGNIINNFNNLELNKRLQVFANEDKFIKPKSDIPSFLYENLKSPTKNKIPSFLVSDKSKKLLDAPKNLSSKHEPQERIKEMPFKKTKTFFDFYNDSKPKKPEVKENKEYKHNEVYVNPKLNDKMNKIIKDAEIKEDSKKILPEHQIKDSYIPEVERLKKLQNFYKMSINDIRKQKVANIDDLKFKDDILEQIQY